MEHKFIKFMKSNVSQISCSNAVFKTLLNVLIPLLHGESDILFMVIVDS